VKSIISEATPIVAMITLAVILITCIANNIDGGIVYSGIATISGLGGYTLGRYRTEKILEKKYKLNHRP